MKITWISLASSGTLYWISGDSYSFMAAVKSEEGRAAVLEAACSARWITKYMPGLASICLVILEEQH